MEQCLWFTCLLVVLAHTQAQGCSDRHATCPFWAKSGECYKNPGFMLVHCGVSCHQCLVQDDACRDLNEQCVAWANNGECNRNFQYMKQNCARACTFCQPANDHSVPHVHSDYVDENWRKYNSIHPGLARIHI
ncbi:hypothetical protein OTU49_012104 [Cherax quadricarinatus]|uniref:ShKT domain-containing protein n=1 Tax=Cherax quadricarinatus TaxID=27406 RepID=A0AAW0W0C3_CHEQU|nr:putative tyrosinase-like protein tyr-3 [Cherax quadricarinatus]